MPDRDTLNQLRQLGLNEYESKAYYALASHGIHTAGALSERADLPRARMYDVLSKLQEKGFVSIQQGRPVKFSALPLSEAVKTLRKQKEASLQDELNLIEGLGKDLQSKLKPSSASSTPTEEIVWSLKGRDSIYSKIGSMIADAKKHVIISSGAEGVARKLKFFSADLKKAKTRGAEVTVVSPEKIDSEHSVKIKSLPTRLVLADDQAVVFLNNAQDPEDELGLWLKSPHFVETIKHAVK